MCSSSELRSQELGGGTRSPSLFLPGWADQLMLWVGVGLAWAEQLALGKEERMVMVSVLLRVSREASLGFIG